ncbi:MDR family MFS transporter [Enterococcus sp. LJL90]
MARKTNVPLVTVCVFVATFMTAIEGTIVTTAMPTIVGSLDGLEIMNWVFSVYLLTNAMMTPIYGKLADKVGRKPIFMLGILIFIIGSSLCGLSNTMLTLIIARAIQGIGAGAIMPVALTIIADMYTVEKRAQVLGFNNAAWGISSVLGPLAGGLIVDTIGWHWIFFINLPIGLVLLGLIYLFLQEEKVPRTAKRVDVVGTITLLVTLFSLLLGFQELENGVSVSVLFLFVIAILAFVIFLKAEKKAEDPIITLGLFKSPLFVAANLVAALVSGYLIGIDVYIPMWMQGVLGISAAIGGLALAPMSILWMAGSFLAGRWLSKFSEQRILLQGLSLVALGGFGLFFLPAYSNYNFFLVISAVIGLGFGITITTATVSVQSSVPPESLGVATSFNTLVRTIGQTVMVSVFGLIINQATAQGLAQKGFDPQSDLMNQLVNPQTAKELPQEMLTPLREILYSGLHRVFLIGLVMVAVAIAVVMLYQQKQKMKVSNS